MATKIITQEIEVNSCDICGEGSDHISTCQVCGDDICPNCRAWNMCKPCWELDYSFATVEIHTTEEGGYEGRTHTHLSLNHESKNKWYAILERYAGQRIKISVEKVVE